MNTLTTIPLTSAHGTASKLADLAGITVTVTGDTFTVSFDNLAVALASVAKAKDAAWSDYLRNGGNARNKRAVGSQWSAIAKALTNAAA